MYYHLNDHIYVAQFRDNLIMLDTKKDQYIISNQQIATSLLDGLKNNLENSGNNTDSFLQILQDQNIITTENSIYPFYIDKKLTSEGIANVDWRLPLNNQGLNLNKHVLQVFGTLIKVNTYMKLKGFYNTLQLIKKEHQQHSSYHIPQSAELDSLARIINKACQIYPTRTKCLEWAMTYVLMALKKGWKCNLEIGVQNYPFMAHAWVECNGQVVMDNQNNRDRLAIILNEPFRRTTL